MQRPYRGVPYLWVAPLPCEPAVCGWSLRPGRSRSHGEVTVGVQGLAVLKEPPKNLYYLRKKLLEYRLITKQVPSMFRHGHIALMNVVYAVCDVSCEAART